MLSTSTIPDKSSIEISTFFVGTTFESSSLSSASTTVFFSDLSVFLLVRFEIASLNFVTSSNLAIRDVRSMERPETYRVLEPARVFP